MKVQPGDVLVVQDGPWEPRDEGVVLEVRKDQMLLLFTTDGCSQAWLPLSYCEGRSKVPDPEKVFRERAKKRWEAAEKAIMVEGARAALHYAERAGLYSTIACIIAALKHRVDVTEAA